MSLAWATLVDTWSTTVGDGSGDNFCGRLSSNEEYKIYIVVLGNSYIFFLDEIVITTAGIHRVRQPSEAF